MPAHAIFPADHGSGNIAPGAGVALLSVAAGVYLGLSTIAEINPFYRQPPPVESEGSYTVNGWRGADAVPAPPATTQAEDWNHSYAASIRPPASYEYRTYTEPVAAYVGGHSNDGATADLPPDDIPTTDADPAEPYVPEPTADEWEMNGESGSATISASEELRLGPA
jgi:hypothetical protein